MLMGFCMEVLVRYTVVHVRSFCCFKLVPIGCIGLIPFGRFLFQAFVNSLKLYADNLLCMDLCCWSGTEATKLLGDQVCEDIDSHVTCM